MDIFFYNTLTRKKDLFVPIKEKEAKIYSCGPTVYKDATIGNMRTNIFQDVLRRTLKYNGYKLIHAMNITDVGHLVSDADEGEDKIIKSANETGKTPLEIAEFYTKKFFRDLELLNIEKPEIICKATDNIDEMLSFVKELVKNNYAYETSKGVYFDVSKLDTYGLLSGINLKEQKNGVRIENDNEKKNPYDFALWIKAPKNHLMKWDSPWGESYPGWHIECSAMSRKYLGEQFDIHTGGVDLIPTHHENEIAQNKGYCGKIPANYWMHGEYLLINGGKMSKSLGNVYLLQDIIDKGYSPLVYRMFCYTTVYRKKLNFTWEAMDAAKTSLERLKEAYKNHENGDEIVSEKEIDLFEEKFHMAINDDLNIPQAMSVVWEVAKQKNKSIQYAKLLEKFDNVLGLQISMQEETNKLPKEIEDLINERVKARSEKNWKKSDELRNIIQSKGYIVKDSANGMKVEKI